MADIRKQNTLPAGKPPKLKAQQESLLEPVILRENKLSHSWWGKAWNKNLESYADYSNRLPRGKSYLRSGMLQGLSLANAHNGDILALVQGSRKKPYKVLVRLQPLSPEKWQQIISLCENKIPSLGVLLEGRFTADLGEIFLNQKFGLFPTPGEIIMACSCPDWSHMCKHVAATLYAIGAKLDSSPALLFELRGVNIHDLLVKSSESKLQSLLLNAQNTSSRVLSDEYIEKLFNL